MKPLGIEPATFRFVAQCLNHWVTAFPDTANKTNKYMLNNIFNVGEFLVAE
jgi:hypothetical protein